MSSPETEIKADVKCPSGSGEHPDRQPWGRRFGSLRKRCGGCLTFPLCLLFSENLSSEQATEMENMKSLVYRLFTALHLEEFQKKREHHLLEKIDHLKGQLQPLEQVWKHLS